MEELVEAFPNCEALNPFERYPSGFPVRAEDTGTLDAFSPALCQGSCFGKQSLLRQASIEDGMAPRFGGSVFQCA